MPLSPEGPRVCRGTSSCTPLSAIGPTRLTHMRALGGGFREGPSEGQVSPEGARGTGES